MGKNSVNFYVGQCVEARSFQMGYRGAWWRCKIIKISRSQHKVFHTLKYLDFLDEKTHKIKLYQKCPGVTRFLANQRHLMVRPQYPSVYRPNEVSNNNGVSEFLVLDNGWKVGDLVDWWKDDVYWSGKITNIFEDEKVEIELVPPPFGEGSLYVASSNALRPSLNWSFNHGWSVPVSQDGGKGRRCAQLIKQKQQVSGNPVCSEPLPDSHVKDEAVEAIGSVYGEDKTVKTTGSVCETKKEDNISMPLNSLVSDTIEAAVLDLEELVNKINWIKSLLEDKKQPSSGSSKSWKFVEHIASSTTPR